MLLYNTSVYCNQCGHPHHSTSCSFHLVSSFLLLEAAPVQAQAPPQAQSVVVPQSIAGLLWNFSRASNALSLDQADAMESLQIGDSALTPS